MVLIFAYQDSDLDGVPDYLDKCPNTNILEQVDINGCSKSQLNKKSLKYYFSLGYEYDNIDASKYAETYLAVKKGKNKLSLYFSYLLNNKKTSDLILSLYHKFNLNKLYYKLGLKVYFPTDLNDKTDFAAKLKVSYYYKNFGFSLSEKHKFYGENYYKDTDTISFSIDSMFNRFYISPYFYVENSKYNTSLWDKYLGVLLSYDINKHISFTTDLSENIEDNKDYTTIFSIDSKF